MAEQESKEQAVKQENESEKPKVQDNYVQFRTELLEFFNALTRLSTSFDIALDAVERRIDEHTERAIQFSQKYGALLRETKSRTDDPDFDEKAEAQRLLERIAAEILPLRNEISKVRSAPTILTRSFVVSLVTEYDALIASLITLFHKRNPEILNASEKKISFAQLIDYGSLEDARIDILEREIESVMYESRGAQIEYLLGKNDIKNMRATFERWADFIEVTQRRNLLSHTNGRVSSQYLKNCKRENVKLSDSIKLGEELETPTQYFKHAYETLLETGLFITIHLWRKFVKGDKEERKVLDSACNTLCFDLLDNQEYSLATRLLEFLNSKEISAGSRNLYKLMLLVNLAQAYKWTDQEKKMEKVLEEVEWETLSPMFQIAGHVLRDNFKEAARLMPAVESDTSKLSFETWPLFKEFRKSREFREQYQAVYGIDYLLDSNQNLKEELEPEVRIDSELK